MSTVTNNDAGAEGDVGAEDEAGSAAGSAVSPIASRSAWRRAAFNGDGLLDERSTIFQQCKNYAATTANTSTNVHACMQPSSTETRGITCGHANL